MAGAAGLCVNSAVCSFVLWVLLFCSCFFYNLHGKISLSLVRDDPAGSLSVYSVLQAPLKETHKILPQVLRYL